MAPRMYQVRYPVLCTLLLAAQAMMTMAQTPSGNYSVRMAQSIISRGQGVVNNESDSSIWLQAGFTQKAFRAILNQYGNATGTQDSGNSSSILEYLDTSVASAAVPLSNATASLKRSLDRNSNGNNLIALYQETGNETYKAGVDGLYQALEIQPRNSEGGLWYFVYPNWSYLDGMFSYAPFYTAYSTSYNTSNTTAALADVVEQIDLLYEHCFDNATQLLVHGYDDSRTAVWANNVTGASPWVWGRAMGWFHMALVDTLELFPQDNEGRESLLDKFKQLSGAVVAQADPSTGAWYQIIGQDEREGNYIESSGSAMFAYALLKGSRLGYLSANGTDAETNGDNSTASTNGTSVDYVGTATKAYEHLVNTFVVDNGNGTLGYNGTVAVCSLNSTATYEYYVGRPILYDSVLGSNAFIMASLEYERLSGNATTL